MVHKYSISIIVLILICFSCSYLTSDENFNSDIVIKTGTVCGWCTINDTLIISGNNIRYVNYTNCSTTKASVEKSGELTSSELDALLKLLDFDELKKLDMNSCNVCVDGCDNWISYESNSQSHYIRFSFNDPKLISIQNFVDRLSEIKSRYSGDK